MACLITEDEGGDEGMIWGKVMHFMQNFCVPVFDDNECNEMPVQKKLVISMSGGYFL